MVFQLIVVVHSSVLIIVQGLGFAVNVWEGVRVGVGTEAHHEAAAQSTLQVEHSEASHCLSPHMGVGVGGVVADPGKQVHVSMPGQAAFRHLFPTSPPAHHKSFPQ